MEFKRTSLLAKYFIETYNWLPTNICQLLIYFVIGIVFLPITLYCLVIKLIAPEVVKTHLLSDMFSGKELENSKMALVKPLICLVFTLLLYVMNVLAISVILDGLGVKFSETLGEIVFGAALFLPWLEALVYNIYKSKPTSKSKFCKPVEFK